MQKIIVDGYNLLHADPKLKRTLRADLRGARRSLMRRLRHYLESKNVRLTVVFDGRGGVTDVDVEIPGRLQVLYSAAGQSADELIIHILQEAANPREYLVVTSDMADIGRAASSMGVQVLPSTDFLSRMGPAPREAPGRRASEDAYDVEYWLGRFDRERENDQER